MNNYNGRNANGRPRVYGEYDVERVKAQTVRSRAANGAGNRSPQSQRPRPDDNRVRRVQQTANGSYRSRRPSGNSSRGNGDGVLWLLIIVIGVMVVIAMSVLVNFLKSDGTPKGDETAPDTTVSTPEATDGETLPPATEETQPPETIPPELAAPVPEFKADLSAYEGYMNPTGDQRDAYLIVVNAQNPLSSDYVPPDLTDVKSTRKDGQRKTQQLREYAAKALEALMLEADACGMVRTNTPSGYPLSVMSAYRTYEYQRYLFYDVYLVNEMNKGLSREAAEAKVATYSNRPGTSEHQAGLCVDMHTLPAANQSFKNQPEATWLAENCHKFGFILRYPEDKLEQTGGIMYEPWHFRYVGRYHATRMKQLNMCLEEYVEYLKTNG